MIAEISLAILAAALRIAAAGRAAFVGIDLEANLGTARQHQNLAGLAALWMADEGVFAGSAGRGPENHVADGVVVRRADLHQAIFVAKVFDSHSALAFSL